VKGLAYILEMIWLLLTVFLVALGIYETVRNGFASSYLLFLLALLSALMYFARRRRRKMSEE
jgi:4-amino-4-deoxy-L-arabinose transferase-like glycosyltransferase